MKFLEVLCLLGITLFPLSGKPLKGSKIIKAINCGSKEGSIKSEGDFKYEHVYHQIFRIQVWFQEIPSMLIIIPIAMLSTQK